MSFMMQIDAARRPPLDQLAVDYWAIKLAKAEPSVGFCCQTLGVPESDDAVARRLGVPVATVRGWREIGRRASSWSCR
jgi:hypothetical protein